MNPDLAIATRAADGVYRLLDLATEAFGRGDFSEARALGSQARDAVDEFIGACNRLQRQSLGPAPRSGTRTAGVNPATRPGGAITVVVTPEQAARIEAIIERKRSRVWKDY